MKKIITILLIAFCLQSSFAQSYQILNTAAGRVVNFASLKDKEELYGYAELRKLDNVSPTEVKYKYSILDKNMNIIVSGEFTEAKGRKNAFLDNYQIVYNNGYVLFNFLENLYSGKGSLMPIKCQFKILNIASNKITASGVYDKEIIKYDGNFTKTVKNVRFYNSIALSDIGFFVHGKSNYQKDLKSDSYAIDFEGKEIWRNKIKEAEKKHVYEYDFFDLDENTISLIATKTRNYKKISEHLLLLDTKTGNEIAFTDLFNEKYTMRFSYSKLDQDKLTIIGRYFEKERRDRVNDDESLGLYKKEFEIKTGKLVSETFVPYSKFKYGFINKNGKIKEEGFLRFQKIDQNPDGSYIIIAETYTKPLLTTWLFTELYTFLLDKDFNPISIKSFDTEKSINSKYSFSQKLLNDTGKVYFFYDKNNEEKLELNMINYNYNSKEVTLSKMNIETKESKISVFPAKTGYIAIKETRSGGSKKEKDQIEIRLEKLNYERQ